MVRFAAGGPFQFVHPIDGTRIMRQLLEFKKNGSADHPVLESFIRAGYAYEEFAAWVHERTGQANKEGIDWERAIKFLEQVGSKASTMVRQLACCGGSASFGGASFIFSTIHNSKGLEYEWVHVVDDGLLPPWHTSIQEAASALTARGVLSEDLRSLVVAGCNGDEKWADQKLNLVYVAITRAKARLLLCGKVATWFMPLDVELSNGANAGGGGPTRKRNYASVFGE
mmetsp:Transcript_73983/g.211259  ORF Transcript_73983/g.211259 Transcript_73983/m.211259 type:complete len:227 (+) Transcript_73983:423-1103(+)